jgi:hypothetical protein
VIPRGGAVGFKPIKGGHYASILSAISYHEWIFLGLKALSVILVILELALGIIISIVTSVEGQNARTAVIILGGLNSFAGGLAGVLQYWGQPTRENRYLASLKLVRSDIVSLLMKFKNPNTDLDPWREGSRVWDTFEQVKADAWSSEPATWMQKKRVADEVDGHAQT